MNWIRGYYRLCLCALTLGLGGTLIVLTSWIPVEIKGFRISFWLLLFTVRALVAILNVNVECPVRPRFRAFSGFVFPNHVTYLDILVLIAVTPMRFLAKEEVRSWPVIGWIATAIGCVYVKREDKKSRAEAKAALAKVETFPPIVLFPEGKRGPGDELLPFRYGAFEIVIQGEVSYLPCVIIYDRLDIAIWRRGEHFAKALWRLATFKGPVKAQLLALEAARPNKGDDAAQLSVTTREALAALIEEHRPQPVAEAS